MKIYTKTGDKGDTSLYGGKRVSKSNLRVAAYGDIDELNSHIGLANSTNKNIYLKKILVEIQRDLFILSSHIATPDPNTQETLPKFEKDKIKNLEKIIDKVSLKLPTIKKFILPSGNEASARLHVARTVCRRAERTCKMLQEKEELFNKVLPYLNRLSDLLFVIARLANNGNDVLA